MHLVLLGFLATLLFFAVFLLTASLGRGSGDSCFCRGSGSSGSRRSSGNSCFSRGSGSRRGFNSRNGGSSYWLGGRLSTCGYTMRLLINKESGIDSFVENKRITIIFFEAIVNNLLYLRVVQRSVEHWLEWLERRLLVD